MTAPDAPASGDTTAGSTPATPGYTSPSEQFQEAMAKLGLNPAWGFQRLFEALGAGAKAAGGGGGQFTFSIDEMRELHRQFRDEADAFDRMREQAIEAGGAVQKLAADPASEMHYRETKKHLGQDLRKAISDQARFARGFEAAVGSALGIKEEGEAAAVDAAKKAGSGL